MGQMGFFDLGNRYTGLDAKNEPLLKIDGVVPWEDLRARLEAVWRRADKVRKSRAGRKPWDAIVMFKTIILCALYNLSDDQVEHQIRDRLSFMRFLGLGLEGRVPDAKTVWLYREQLTQAGVIEALFETFDGYLKDQGYLAMGGQIIDASIVAVPKQRNSREENARIKAGETPAGSLPCPAPRDRVFLAYARFILEPDFDHFTGRNVCAAWSNWSVSRRPCDDTRRRRPPGDGLEAEITQLERGRPRKSRLRHGWSW